VKVARKRTRRPQKRRDRPRILIVESRFYNDISDMLLKGATRALDQGGANYERVTVPGSLEIPVAIAMAVDAAQRKTKPYDGVVALGCVIRGETYHFEIVSDQSAQALVNLSVAHLLPIANGILTVDTESQAHARASVDEEDKGGAAARATLALVRLKRALAGR
jgi:6,7-dimethyl-8-ribityllumazine synthase